MRHSKYFIIGIVLLGFALSGYQCASTEITSAKLYIQQKNYDKALESLLKEVEKNPKSDEGFYLLGVIYGEKGEFENMMNSYKSSLDISKRFEKNISDSKKYYWANAFNKGVAYYQRGNSSTNSDTMKIFLDQSLEAFRQAIMIEPDSADTYKNIAFVYMSQQNYNAAVEPLEKLIELEKALEGYKFLGEILYNLGTSLEGKYSESKDVNDSLQAMKYFDRTIKLLEEGRKLYPNDADILLILSSAYVSAKKVDVAIDAFKAGVEKDPANKYYRYNYGVLLLGVNNYADAVHQFEKALEVDPTYQNALYNAAVAYVKWGSKLGKEAEELGKESPEAKEKYNLALPFLEKVVALNPDEATNWELIGRVYAVLGMQEKANDAFNKADNLRK